MLARPTVWLFDVDGTLVDSQPLILDLWRETTRAVLGRQLPDEQLLAGMALPVHEHAAMIDGGRAGELAEGVLERYAARAGEVRPFAGMEAALAALARRGCRLGIVTSKQRRTFAPTLAALRSAPLFAAIVTAEDTDRHKPDPAPVVRALELLGAAPDDAILVGDSRYDLRAARAAGIRSGAALWGALDAPALLAERPDAVFATPAQLLPAASAA